MAKYKLKTSSSAKKRFKISANGTCRITQAGKRHGMHKRGSKMLRTSRGRTNAHSTNVRLLKRYLMPND